MRPAERERPSGGAADRFGAVASSLCAAHCFICALAPAAFGALGVGALLSEGAEWFFTLIAVAFAIAALLVGWRRNLSPRLFATLLLIGIAGLLAARGIEGLAGHDHGDHAAPMALAATHTHDAAHATAAAPYQPATAAAPRGEYLHALGAAVGVLAGLLLVAGHLVNLRAVRRCRPKYA